MHFAPGTVDMNTVANRKTAIVIHERDVTANVIAAVDPGDRIDVQNHAFATEVIARTPVPALHKIALVAIAKGQVVLRGGYRIGCATEDIGAGEWVHVHNLEGGRAR